MTTAAPAPVLVVLPGFCGRCDRPALLPLGGPEELALCPMCRAAENLDRVSRFGRLRREDRFP